MRSTARLYAIVLALIALSLVPRLVGIDRFVTVDEPYWVTAGSDFYYALGQREFAKTVYDYHPAVTTMWIVATAMLVYFPQYRGLGQGYFDVYKDSLDQFLLAHGRTPLGLLVTARVLQALVIAGLLAVLFLLLRRLLDERAAVAAALLIAFDPFFLGHSRLLNHEGLMTMFALVSVMAAMSYVFDGHKLELLVLSGVAAGLAQLTKSSAVVIVPVVGVLCVAAGVRGFLPEGKRLPARGLRDLGIWLAVTAAVYVILWPGMWVAPGAMLQEVFGNAASYALAGARLSSAVEPSAALQPQLMDVWLYVQSMLWRTTPIAWIGVILAAAAFFRADGQRRTVLAAIATVGTLFVLLFGLAAGRNSAHYVLASYAAIDILAAAGYADAATRLGGRVAERLARWAQPLVLSAAVILQATSALGFQPYYYTYFSPIMEAGQAGRQNPNFGYGEGLDLAADYLDGKAEAQGQRVMAFYGRGPFSYLYSGPTEPLKTVYAEAENVPQLQQVLKNSDYLVIYYALQHGRNAPANVMHALEGVAPETSIWLNGIEYVRVYAVRDLPADFYDRLWP